MAAIGTFTAQGDGYAGSITTLTFRDAGSYYATLGHECVHWTGHETRLARDFSRSAQAYAREELVAELGAAFLCADLELELEPREDHAAYLGHWLDVLIRVPDRRRRSL